MSRDLAGALIHGEDYLTFQFRQRSDLGGVFVLGHGRIGLVPRKHTDYGIETIRKRLDSSTSTQSP